MAPCSKARDEDGDKQQNKEVKYVLPIEVRPQQSVCPYPYLFCMQHMCCPAWEPFGASALRGSRYLLVQVRRYSNKVRRSRSVYEEVRSDEDHVGTAKLLSGEGPFVVRVEPRRQAVPRSRRRTCCGGRRRVSAAEKRETQGLLSAKMWIMV